jgi:hypothetical protein
LRLVSTCIASLTIDVVSECGHTCGAGADFNMQIDSSPTAPVNPFGFLDGIAPVCL